MTLSTSEVDGPVRIQLRSRADGSTNDLPAGSYLASYDTDGNDGWGEAVWTDNPAACPVRRRCSWPETATTRVSMVCTSSDSCCR
jgi:hypothetical protein